MMKNLFVKTTDEIFAKLYYYLKKNNIHYFLCDYMSQCYMCITVQYPVLPVSFTEKNPIFADHRFGKRSQGGRTAKTTRRIGDATDPL